MQSEQRLKVSYDKQKGQFEVAKEKKIANLQKREAEISQKIEKLSGQLNEVRQQIQKENSRSFRDFDSFKKTALQQSNQKRDPKN